MSGRQIDRRWPSGGFRNHVCVRNAQSVHESGHRFRSFWCGPSYRERSFPIARPGGCEDRKTCRQQGFISAGGFAVIHRASKSQDYWTLPQQCIFNRTCLGLCDIPWVLVCERPCGAHKEHNEHGSNSPYYCYQNLSKKSAHEISSRNCLARSLGGLLAARLLTEQLRCLDLWNGRDNSIMFCLRKEMRQSSNRKRVF